MQLEDAYVGARSGLITITALFKGGPMNAFNHYRGVCDCGTEVTGPIGHLGWGTVSCGCAERSLENAYKTAHIRVKRQRGRAKDYPCFQCGNPAFDWAYRHNDPDEKYGATQGYRAPFSNNPDFYEAMCKTCHRNYDNDHRRNLGTLRP